MISVDSKFEFLLDPFDLEELNKSKSIIYGVDPDFKISYLNEEWFEFSKANGGEPEISEKWGLQSSILDTIPDPLIPFYTKGYRKCLEESKTWEHEFECSSTNLYRKYHQIAYPLKNNQGILIVNSLVVESTHSIETENNLIRESYISEEILRQCCHCRRVKNPKKEEAWDWIPTWVENPYPNTSHGICPTCYKFYYSEILSQSASISNHSTE